MILFSLSARELIEVVKAKESSIQNQGERPAGPPQKVAVGKSARWPSAIPNPTPGVLDARAGPPTAVPAIICFPRRYPSLFPAFVAPIFPPIYLAPLSPFLLCLPGPSPPYICLLERHWGLLSPLYFRSARTQDMSHTKKENHKRQTQNLHFEINGFFSCEDDGLVSVIVNPFSPCLIPPTYMPFPCVSYSFGSYPLGRADVFVIPSPSCPLSPPHFLYLYSVALILA